MAHEPSIPIETLLEHWATFHLLIDVRTPNEWALDHLPGAINLPVLSNEERILVGTRYAREPFEAKRIGAALVARNIAGHLEQALKEHPRDQKALVYCWRGGHRSQALATVMSRIGWRVTLLQGGHQAYRRFLVRDLEGLATQFHYRVVCGVTGSGKTQYLRELSLQGHQVLDLEGLAHHRGSLLGSEPEGQQPSQKSFESQIWYQLRRFDAARPVYVESESRKIGQVQLPQALIEQMRASECIELNVSLDDRIEFLCHEYAHFFEQTDLLRMKLEKLLPLVGSVQLQDWSAMIESRDWAALVASLLNTHYDPAYAKSMARNYRHYAQAQQLPYRPSRIASRSGKTFTPVS